MKAGDCSETTERLLVFHKSKNKRNQLDSTIVCSVRVDQNVAATVSHGTHLLTCSNSSSAFYILVMSLSFVLVNKTRCER